MRAPPLARIAAVAAPRPDAEPVTIAHKPSLDIRIPRIVLKLCSNRPFPASSIARGKVPANRSNPRRGIYLWLTISDTAALPPLQVALRTALVRAMAFPHHKAQ